MKKTMALAVTVLMFSQFASALSVKPGSYTGKTDDGKICNISIDNEYGTLHIGLFYPGAFGDGVRFSATKVTLDRNILSVSGSADMAAAKAKVTLANDGTPVESLMGIGPFVKLGYDINCKNLVQDK